MPRRKNNKTSMSLDWLRLENKQAWALVVFVVVWGVYVLNLPNVAVGYGDGDLFLTMADKLGVMKAPGYPLYVALLNLFTRLPLGTAMGGHLLSSVLAAITTSVVFMLSWDLYALAKVGQKKEFVLVSEKFERWFMALLTSITLGWSGIFWVYALVTERFMLSALLMTVIVWLFVDAHKIQKSDNAEKKWWQIAGVLGLAMSHSWSFWLLVPVLVGYWYLNKQRFSNLFPVVVSVITVSLAVLPYLLLWRFKSNGVTYSYVFGDGVGNLAKFVASGYVGDGQLAIPEGSFLPTITIRLIFGNLWKVLKSSSMSLGLGAGLPLIMSVVYYNKKDSEKCSFFSILVYLGISLAVGLALILPWPDSDVARALSEANLLMFQVVLVLIMWFGWRELIKRVGKGLVVLASEKVVIGLFLVVILGPSLLSVREMLTRRSLSHANNLDQMYENMLLEVEDNALVTCYSYTSCYNLIYQQQVKKLRGDVDIVPFYWDKENLVVKYEDITGFSYSNFPHILFDVVTWNLNKRPVYSVDIFERYYQFYGIDFGFMNFVPYGYYGQLTQTIPELGELPETDYSLSESVISSPNNPWDLMADRFEVDLARKHSLNAQVYMKMGLRDRAFTEMNFATTILYRFSQEEQDQMLRVREMIESTRESQYYETGSELKKVDYILESIDGLLEASLLGRALDVAKGAVTVDPTSVKARMAWADILNRANQVDRAVEEYKNVILLDPNNREAREKLTDLKTIDGGVSEEGEEGVVESDLF